MGALFSKKKRIEDKRRLTANDVEYNAGFKYVNNKIKTSHYTWYNFLFVNLFEQFHRVVNIYFIFQLILTCIPEISSLTPITTLIPIIFVLAITAIKDAVDDFNRHRSDKEINHRIVNVVAENGLEKRDWCDVTVGNIVKLENNDKVCADFILLSSSDENNRAFIDTAELDGETNLKERQALQSTAKLGEHLGEIFQFRGRVECEAPNNILHKFVGTLQQDGTIHSLDNNNLMLRGCTIRNTTWCYGLVIFAGHDTKLMQNAGKLLIKRTKIERFMNILVWWIFGALFLLAMIAAIANSVWEDKVGRVFQVYLPWPDYADNPTMSGFLSFWSYIIILNTLVPISLYVSVEIIRLGQSWLIEWDRLLYYEKKNLPAVARTTTLNEELGQVEYIFSDKTGTLTQNVMRFDRCTINGKRYGDKHAIQTRDEHDTKGLADLSYNKYLEPNFRFYDQRMIDAITSNDEDVIKFFRLLALCHNVQIEKDETGSFIYRAQSPDENALVGAARNFGIVYKERSYDKIILQELDKEVEYQVLALLDFDNVRKRSSIILRYPNGKIYLLCKGADSVIYNRIQPSESQYVEEKTQKHLDNFARNGLRTLCLAMKEIDEPSYNVWRDAYDKAKVAIEDREDRMTAVYEEIEKDMTLIGATAIEDKLQDGVPETIANLSNAQIKIWVLTGDKQETAVNIGYSCHLLSESMQDVFIVAAYEKDKVEKEIASALEKIELYKANQLGSYQNGLGGEVNKAFTPDNISTGNLVIDDEVEENTEEAETHFQLGTGYALVINGHSLVSALEPELEEKFLDLASRCSSVIVCRATPLQKAKVVELVKTKKKAITLAIGDGANDVSMIKAAHIGIGISGEEGNQAVLSSDYSLGQFRFLERLLLVHGRWSYMRMCKFLGYFFYKNFAYTLMHFWYSIFNGWSAQTVFNDWFITLYPIVYTSIPILVLAMFDQDVDDKMCIRLPKLYVQGQRNELFNSVVLLRSLGRGLYVSLVVYFVCYGAFYTGMANDGLTSTDYQSFATVAATTVLIVVTLQVALESNYWTIYSHIFIWGSILIYFPCTWGLASDGLYNLLPSSSFMIGSTTQSLRLATTWFTILLSVVICFLPVITTRYYNSMFNKTDFQKAVEEHCTNKERLLKNTETSQNQT